MKNINDFPKIADGLFIGNLKKFLKIKGEIPETVKTIYIAPATYLDSINSIDITDVEILPFNGGFKADSLILFSLETENDIKYFNKITGYYIGKKGELISDTKIYF
jgi:hypothetical protein